MNMSGWGFDKVRGLLSQTFETCERLCFQASGHVFRTYPFAETRVKSGT